MRFWHAAVWFALAAGPLGAQQVQTLDRVVAVVGTRPILFSQLEEQVVQARAQGIDVPQDSAALADLYSELLDQMVDEQLVVQQAERDTMVRVTDQEVQDAVEQTVQNVRRQFGSDAEFETQLRQAGFATAEEWRRFLADQQRRVIMRQRLLESLRAQGKLRPITPTDSAMRAFWEQNRGNLPRRPPVVSFRQIVVEPQADSVTRAAALHLAESLYVELRRGADFATVARRFSDDTSTRSSGGALGCFRRGVMVRNFEMTAFSMRPGEISTPVLTQYGYHVIRLDRIQTAEVCAHHVLIAPKIGPAEIVDTHRLADSIYQALGAGVPFDTLARRYSDPSEQKLAERVPLSELPREYQERLNADSSVGLMPPFIIDDNSPRPRFVILQVLERQSAGTMSYEDMRNVIRERLGNELAMQQYLRQLRKQTYVDIRL